MSEEKKESFMQALDAWMDVNVIAPLIYSGDEADVETTEEQIVQVKKVMHAKMLDSYHNGRRAGAAGLAEGTRRPSPKAPLRQAMADGQCQRQPVYQR